MTKNIKKHFVVVNLDSEEAMPIECENLRYLDSGWIMFYNNEDYGDEIILGLPSKGFLFYAVSPEEYAKVLDKI